MTQKELMQIRDLLELVHHIPGRARVKGSMSLFNLPATKELMALAKGKSAGDIASFRVNLLARSVSIDYDVNRIAPALIDELFTTKDSQRVAQLSTELAQLFGIDLLLQE